MVLLCIHVPRCMHVLLFSDHSLKSEFMNYATTVERVSRLLIMLVRELYMKGDVDSAMSLTGMSSETICAIGEAPLDAIEELFNNVSTSLFAPRLGSAEFAILMKLQPQLKAPYALLAQRGN